MTEKPILFSAPMVRAILSGQKTVTRRIVRNPEYFGCLTGDCPHWDQKLCDADIREKLVPDCPYGAPSDRLWVRETFYCDDFRYPDAPHDELLEFMYYRADHEDWGSQFEGEIPVWRPSIHMPRWASRITLEITDIRVERLQEITEEDAVAEGVAPLFDPVTAKSRPELDLDPMPYLNYLWHGNIGKSITAKQSDEWNHQFSSYGTAVGSFSSLWESINGKGSWEQNPFVWAVSFRQI